ncbi:MAG TPA: hypothetical protein VKG23_05155 [Thermoanaerobaculia bacterium]|nr:hypothetical protein [Thermoanaerobaculia bacterium]
MDARVKAFRGFLFAVVILVAGLAAGLAWPGLRVVLAAAGFVGYVVLAGRVVRDLDADTLVFSSRGAEARRRAHSAIRAGLATGAIGNFLAARAAVPRAPGRERRRRPRPGWPAFPHQVSPKAR